MTRELYLNPGLPINPNKEISPIKPIEDTKHASVPEKSAHEDSKLKESIPEKSISKTSKSEKNAPEKSAPQNVTGHEMSAKPDHELVKKSLKETNFYLPLMEITNEIELNVNPLNVLRTGKIKMSFMEPNTNGICIIINNFSNKLDKESKRFKNVFEQLKFYVEEYYDISANEMIERLKNFALDKRLEEDISLVVMIISHGYNEKVVGSNGEELQISTIVDIFSEDNCKAMHKLFFFNCCRNNSQEFTARDQSLNNKIDVILEPVDQNGINKNKYTLICFTYAEAYKSWFGQNEFTYFGQALSHCIAQYACDTSFQQIMNLTCETAEQLLIKSQKENIRLYKIFRELSLNFSLPIEDEIEDFYITSMANNINQVNNNEILTEPAIGSSQINVTQEANDLKANKIFSQIAPEIKEKYKYEIESFEKLENYYIMKKELFLNDLLYLNTHSNNASMNELGEKIGSGGFGDVFKHKDDNNLCIKIVPIKNLNIEEKLKLTREVDIMIRLQSEYVVKYHNCYVKNEYLCIQMERCYLNLRSIIEIKRNEFSRKKDEPMEKLEFCITCELFEEILECLNYLHSKEIIHRDLNPANILITDKGTNGRFIKIGDFGLAKYHELKSQSMKHTTDVGTIEYVAPEVRSGRNYGIKADYFSIGVTMSEMFEIEIPMLKYPKLLDQEFLLKPNYNGMKELCKDLLNDNVAVRPNCTQSKLIMKTWAIKLNDLTDDNEFINLKKGLLSDIAIKESFHKFFLTKKLRI